MYKVLVVDDEPAIRKGLLKIVDWESLGFCVVGDVSNGIKAVALHQELSPDLIVIDIRMPRMDGLQAIREIRKTDGECQFLILSGYADFAYAKQAMEMGVSGYVLKPIDKLELKGELLRIRSKLDQRSGHAKLSEFHVDALREELILKLIAADPADAPALESELLPLTNFVGKSKQILLVEAEDISQAGLERLESVKTKWLEAAEEEDLGYGFQTGPYIGFLLKGDLNRHGVKSEWIRLLQDAGGLQVGFTAAAGRIVYKLADIRQSYEGALGVLRNRFLLAEGQIHLVTEPVLSHTATEPNRHAPPDLEALATKLFYMLDLGRGEGVAETLEEAGRALAAYDSSESAIKSGLVQVLSVALSNLAALHQNVNIQDYAPLLAELYQHAHYDKALCAARTQLVELAGRLGGNGSLPVVKQVMDFIQRHYHENLKLETMAEIFNYHKGYLGKMFKQHTGDSFHTYLDKVRIQQAIRLLREGHKVYEVSERVGYPNVDYFHSKFKKYIGAPPSSIKGAPPKAKAFSLETT
ncbi:response regulator transcription factor [Paenibacillus caseinilyticus]|uniref:AraC family transcriptional regulator n=1 Tax=Paenibacillus mucilaginosus K02 TaxID=997761 RepID=I0BK99_9BACL|nr:response regulator [Paenibacillus mucilaginosus]AFH62796.1 AraC family transcriptional regulator [Paenibacillus mucilaginosus K02]